MAQKSDSAGVGCLLIVIFVVVCAVAGYQAADDAVYIPHSGNAKVEYPAHVWEVGEYVTYAALNQGNPELLLDCSGPKVKEEPIREMSVTFWGKVETKPKLFKCQRNSDSITCHLDDTQSAANPSK